MWRLAFDEATAEPKWIDEAHEAVERKLHKTIAKVGHDIETMGFNTAIAAMIELVNSAKGGMTADQLGRFVVILAPFTPHVAEEIWHKLGHDTSVAHAEWPGYDETMLVDDEIEIPVQILGKVKARIRVPAGADGAALEAAALADEKIQQLLAGKTVRKVISVPGRLVNIVAD